MSDARSNRTIFGLKGPFKVIISIITLGSFLFSSISYDIVSLRPIDFVGQAWAAKAPLGLTSVGPNSPGGPGFIKVFNADTFSLPAYLGHIQDKCQIPPRADEDKEGRRFIIHIQDAHANYAAQKRIAEIIEYLSKEYAAETINLEGGTGEYDLSIFTGIYDKRIREKVADNFVKEGLVTGAEYFVINNPDKAILWGIEDTDLYIENLNIYRESLKHKEEVDKYLKTLDHILANLKRHIYSKELTELDLHYAAYKSGAMEFKKYIAYLVSSARRKAMEIKSYRNIFLLNQALDEEEKIDFNKANRERDDLIGRLEKRLSQNGVDELILRTLAFKAEKIEQIDFYRYLIEKARAVDVDIAYFPELQKYIVYISTYAAINKPKVISELAELEDGIKELIYENDVQRELGRLSKHLALLKNIFAISLTKDDYTYYKENSEGFDMSNYISFTREHSSSYGITAKLDDGVEVLDVYRENITRFYECSLKRDEAFIRNLKFSRLPSKPTIIVTGGFHSENLCSLFKMQGISYVSIMPTFTNEEGYESPYFKLLAGEVTGIQKRLYSVLASAPVSLIQIASIHSELLALPVWGKANIDAYKAAVLINEQEERGRKFSHIDRADGRVDNMAVVFTTPEGDLRWSIRELLYNTHERFIDKLLAEAYLDIDANVEGVSVDVRQMAAEKIMMIRAGLLGSIVTLSKVSQRYKKVSDNAENLRYLAVKIRLVEGWGGVPINLVKIGDADFEGHAGGMGININAKYDQRNTEDAERMADIIVHEAIAGITGDHFLSAMAEEGVRQETLPANLIAELGRTDMFDAPIWEMTPEEKLEIDRDYNEDIIERRLRLDKRSQYDRILRETARARYLEDIWERLVRAPRTITAEDLRHVVKNLNSGYALGRIINPAIAQGDRIVVFRVPGVAKESGKFGIKELNDKLIGYELNTRLIDIQHKLLLNIMIRRGLINDKDARVYSTYKDDVYHIREDIPIETIKATLEEASKELTDKISDILRGDGSVVRDEDIDIKEAVAAFIASIKNNRVPGREEGIPREFFRTTGPIYEINFGIGKVEDDTPAGRITADMNAHQAVFFDGKEFTLEGYLKIIKEIYDLREEIITLAGAKDIAIFEGEEGRYYLNEDVSRISRRRISWNELDDGSRAVFGNDEILYKKTAGYLDLIGVQDYIKRWQLDREEALKKAERADTVARRLQNRIDAALSFDADLADDLKEAKTLIEEDARMPTSTSRVAFHARAPPMDNPGYIVLDIRDMGGMNITSFELELQGIERALYQDIKKGVVREDIDLEEIRYLWSIAADRVTKSFTRSVEIAKEIIQAAAGEAHIRLPDSDIPVLLGGDEATFAVPRAIITEDLLSRIMQACGARVAAIIIAGTKAVQKMREEFADRGDKPVQDLAHADAIIGLEKGLSMLKESEARGIYNVIAIQDENGDWAIKAAARGEDAALPRATLFPTGERPAGTERDRSVVLGNGSEISLDRYTDDVKREVRALKPQYIRRDVPRVIFLSARDERLAKVFATSRLFEQNLEQPGIYRFENITICLVRDDDTREVLEKKVEQVGSIFDSDGNTCVVSFLNERLTGLLSGVVREKGVPAMMDRMRNIKTEYPDNGYYHVTGLLAIGLGIIDYEFFDKDKDASFKERLVGLINKYAPATGVTPDNLNDLLKGALSLRLPRIEPMDASILERLEARDRALAVSV